MRTAFAFALLFSLAPAIHAANLDVTASYKMRATSYRNLDLGQDVNNHSFLSNDARLGIAVKKIVLVRPAVEAGERLGFLPGDLVAKINPYLRPLFDSLNDMVGLKHPRLTSEIVPLCFG